MSHTHSNSNRSFLPQQLLISKILHNKVKEKRTKNVFETRQLLTAPADNATKTRRSK